MNGTDMMQPARRSGRLGGWVAILARASVGPQPGGKPLRRW